ncbi:adult-specific cuticular protein ACP-22-like [Hylaeus volcanicus]|uniref:adult-specific cuticular protein ACP-22-like n=1 Tax=Hylaeus volcanicus TaxID=313075 RepID=UPI0023B82EAA|nr:adult-specific cuticular protein ACP-22-like [Hylaeus volcanicus]
MIGIALTIVLTLGHRSHAGVIALERDETYHGQQTTLEDAFHGRHASLVSSYVQFHGPVEGPDYEVKVPRAAEYHDDSNHLHGQEHNYAVDYVAHPKYEFSYGVEDQHTGDFHNQKEARDGNSVSGEYSVKEPGGSIRVVRYHADKDGFHAVVHTSGENDHAGGLYGGQGQAQVHDHQTATQQEQDVPHYAANEEEY